MNNPKVKQYWLLIFIALAVIAFALTIPFHEQPGDGLLRFFGRFHVLILHFPITLLLLAPALELLSRLVKFKSLKPYIDLFWWVATLSAAATVILGLLLASNEGYPYSEVEQHLLGGITVVILAVICTLLRISLNNQQHTGRSHHLTIKNYVYTASSATLIIMVMFTAHQGGNLVHGDTYLTNFAPAPIKNLLQAPSKTLDLTAINDQHFIENVRPLLKKHCFGCHGSDTQKGSVQLDNLNPDFIEGHDAPHWHAALDMINAGEMPPAKKKQPTLEERRIIVDWITQGIKLAKAAKKGESKTVMRRLTKQQYTNSLQSLLGIDINFGDDLPSDSISEMGFTNNAELLSATSLHLEYFRKIAKKALDKTINIGDKPPVTHYRVNYGKNLGKGEPNNTSKGAQGFPVVKEDFYTEVFDENHKLKQGKNIDKIKKLITASLRGSDPLRVLIENDGIKLFSATPQIEKVVPGNFGAWHAPSPNVSMQIKTHHPHTGPFVLRVKASPSQSFDFKLNNIKKLSNTKTLTALDPEFKPVKTKDKQQAIILASETMFNQNKALIHDKQYPRFWQPKKGPEKFKISYPLKARDLTHELYQVEIVHLAVNNPVKFEIFIDKRTKLKVVLTPQKGQIIGTPVVSPVALVRLSDKHNKYRIAINGAKDLPGISDIVFTKINENSKLAKTLPKKVFKNITSNKNIARLTPYIGTRTDDGVDFKTVSSAIEVTQPNQVLTFNGYLENFPAPAEGEGATQSEQAITNGSLKIGVWNNDMIKHKNQKGSAVKIHYIEFEAPYFPQWPTKQHNAIFFDSPHEKNSQAYAVAVISKFAEKAFRRPLYQGEITPYINLWQQIKGNYTHFEASIKEVLAAILTSPSFLYLAEPKFIADNIPQKEKNSPTFFADLLSPKAHAGNQVVNYQEYALASRLSYFLWNNPPDTQLLKLASQGKLTQQLEQQIDRMLADDKVTQFVEVFAKEWLKLDRQKIQTVDIDSYLDYSRYVKHDMQQETINFITLLIKENLSLLNIINSDFAMLNQNLAEFYGIKNITGDEFQKVTLPKNTLRGGLLTQGAFLTGHSDGIHGHPVKRAVWLKEKILGDPPPPPPPNVPSIDPETPGFEKLTLKEQLELHRDKDSCRDCHAKIDPYGIVFEEFDAVGRIRTEYKGKAIDASTLLPNGKRVTGVKEMQDYLLNEKSDEVALSVIKHLFAYALGRDVSFYDDNEINQILTSVKNNNYQMQALIHAIVTSPSFLKTQQEVNHG